MIVAPFDQETAGQFRQVHGLQVASFKSRAAMGRASAEAIALDLRTRLERQAEVRMVFAAAPSQAEMLGALCALPGIAWERVRAFHMDEYIGLAPGAPERFARWLDGHIFERLAFGSVHRIVPEPDPDAAAAAYAEALAAAPIDVVCLGIGVNGHLAFNDPHIADFNDPLDVKIVELDETCRRQQVEDACFPRLEGVPHTAISLTLPRLMRADRLFCVAPGARKRQAVRQALYGPVSTACPASILRTADCTLYLDKDSDPDASDD